MKNNVIKRLRQEMRSYRESLVTGKLTVEQLFGEAYQIVMKQEIVDAMEQLSEEVKLPNVFWKWMASKDSILDYIYQLWADCDYTFSKELMELLYMEVERDREGHSRG